MAPDAVGPCSPVMSANHVGKVANVASPHPPLLATSPPPLEPVPELLNGQEYSDNGPLSSPPPIQEFRPPPLSQGVPSIELPEGKLRRGQKGI